MEAHVLENQRIHFTIKRMLKWRWTLKETYRRIHVPFGVAYGSDKNKVREAGLSAARAVKDTIIEAGREPEVWLVGFGDSSLNFELVVWVGQEMAISPSRTHAIYLWELESALRERDLEIPFPQRDLHIKSGSRSRWRKRQTKTPRHDCCQSNH